MTRRDLRSFHRDVGRSIRRRHHTRTGRCSIVLSPGNPSWFDTLVNSSGLVTSGHSSAPRDEREASTAGRNLDRGAIPAAGQQAVLLPRHIDQFHQQEIAAYANERDGCQDKQNVAWRQRLSAAALARFGRSRLKARHPVTPCESGGYWIARCRWR